MNDRELPVSGDKGSGKPEGASAPSIALPVSYGERGAGQGPGGKRSPRASKAAAEQLKLVVRVAPQVLAHGANPPGSSPGPAQTAEATTPVTEGEPDSGCRVNSAFRGGVSGVNVGVPTSAPKARPEAEVLAHGPNPPRSSPGAPEIAEVPARMLNEFVYCPRLFHYEFVEGIFVESMDTLRGAAIHQRVDSGSGALPKAKRKAEPDKPKAEEKTSAAEPAGKESGTQVAEPETIHSRSVQMGSERLGVVAKMDLVEVQAARDSVAIGEAGDLFSALEVCPVDYKAGAPKEGQDANELWDTDKMQLGLQVLILRDNGYTCGEGVIYYRATKQRVRLPVTSELESWILENVAEAKRVITGPMPVPLVHSPKCTRCSLAPVCLPDETQILAHPTPEAGEPPRRLIAARDDTRALYLNTQGYRVGCKDEVLVVKEKERVVEEVRMRDVSHVALFGNIQISTQAIQALCELEVPVTYFSMGGWFYGITRGHGMKNVFLRMEQFRLARDGMTCLALARRFVHGKIRNHRTLLMRNHLEPPEGIIAKLKRASEDALTAGSIEELLGIEGAAASQYFQQFSGMVKVEDDLAGPDTQRKDDQ